MAVSMPKDEDIGDWCFIWRNSGRVLEDRCWRLGVSDLAQRVIRETKFGLLGRLLERLGKCRLAGSWRSAIRITHVMQGPALTEDVTKLPAGLHCRPQNFLIQDLPFSLTLAHTKEHLGQCPAGAK